MSDRTVEESSPRNNREYAQLVIEWIDHLSIEYPNMERSAKYRQAAVLAEMQITKQQDLPSRDDAKPSPEDSPNKSPNKPSNITITKPSNIITTGKSYSIKKHHNTTITPKPRYRMRQGIRFRTSRRVAGKKKYPEYSCHNTGWFIDISLNISKMTPEELSHPEFPVNVPQWRLRSHPDKYKGLDITKIPPEEQRYFGGRPVICNSELKQDSCGLAVTGLKSIKKHFSIDEKGHVRMQCIKCTKRTHKRRRDAIRKAEGRKKGQRVAVGKGRPRCINGNLCMGTKMKPQYAKKNYDESKMGFPVFKSYCEACYFNGGKGHGHYPVKPKSTKNQIYIQPSDQSDEEYHVGVRAGVRNPTHAGIGNQNARKYPPSESGEKTFTCVDCKGKKSYPAIRCRECHDKWSIGNPPSLTPKQKYAIRKGKGYWDDETQSFKTGTRPR